MDLRILLTLALIVSACTSQPDPPDGGDAGTEPDPLPTLSRVYRGPDMPAELGCNMSSPLMIQSQGEDFILLTSMLGGLQAFNPENGELAWDLTLNPGPDIPRSIATPAIIPGNRAVVTYATLNPEGTRRNGNFITVVDLDTRDFAADYEELAVNAVVPNFDNSRNVEFFHPTQHNRGQLRHVLPLGSTFGRVYVPYGGPATTHPWHGWLFELDMDAWRVGGAAAAISGVFVTTRESNDNCGVHGRSGGREAICGGGIWTHSGPQIIETDDSYEIIVSIGNGQTDLTREDYANAVLRLPPGLAFDSGCDPTACAGFDSIDPAIECLESCENVFIPRLRMGDPPLIPDDGACDGMTFQECYAWMDMDLGSCAPRYASIPDGPDVVIQCGKDGSAYLFDADHFGLMYDRHQMVALCGTAENDCPVFWLGQANTQPEVIEIDGQMVAIIITMNIDDTHPAGVVALNIVLDGEGNPRFEPRWEAPSRDSPEAVERFRMTSSRMVVAPYGRSGEPYLWFVEGRPNHLAYETRIWGIRARDGLVVASEPIDGLGQRFVQPLLVDDMLYVTSCAPNEAHIEAWRIE